MTGLLIVMAVVRKPFRGPRLRGRRSENLKRWVVVVGSGPASESTDCSLECDPVLLDMLVLAGLLFCEASGESFGLLPRRAESDQPSAPPHFRGGSRVCNLLLIVFVFLLKVLDVHLILERFDCLCMR